MILLILVLIIVGSAVFVIIENKNAEAKRHNRAVAYKVELQKMQETYQARHDEIIQQYGNYSLDICIDFCRKYVVENHIYVFEDLKILYVLNEPIPFDKILCFELKENQNTVTKTTSPKYKTTTDTGSMLGRAIVGGVLTGGIGAVVGAATATKKTEVVEEGKITTRVEHKYRIILTIDDLLNPTRVIDFKDGRDKAEQTANLLNVILHRNKEDAHNQ